jgi:hypothetical protein
MVTPAIAQVVEGLTQFGPVNLNESLPGHGIPRHQIDDRCLSIDDTSFGGEKR